LEVVIANSIEFISTVDIGTNGYIEASLIRRGYQGWRCEN